MSGDVVTYGSTRGRAPAIGFSDTLLAGLAPDGGLYLPHSWPSLTTLPAGDYCSVATEVMAPFVAPDIALDDFRSMVAEAYGTFRHPEVCPLVELDDGLYLLELFHGPTLAFKDVALQLLGRLFDHELRRRGERITIVGATSGDTGSAAMDAVANSDLVDMVILFPKGRTSEVQRRQMTTLAADNVHAVAIDGTFDDCQDLVKAMFADEPFRTRVRLSAVNSINWARVMAQTVYYVWAVQQLADTTDRISFCVPTGNFGNVFAGHGARRMGLPMDRLMVASNTNDILTRLLATGELRSEAVVPTLSPSMDIQISSNLERLLYELMGHDGAATEALLLAFRDQGVAALTAEQHRLLGEGFVGDCLSDEETLSEIAEVYERVGMMVDPHTAVGIGAARRLRRPDECVVSLATAHPAKFPDAVEKATGVRPRLPDHLHDLLERPERVTDLACDLATVEDFVESVRR